MITKYPQNSSNHGNSSDNLDNSVGDLHIGINTEEIYIDSESNNANNRQKDNTHIMMVHVHKDVGGSGSPQHGNMNSRDHNRSGISHKSFCWKIWRFVDSYQIPVLLVIFAAFGLLYPAPGISMSKTKINIVFVIIIFFLSGLKLKTDDLKDIIHHKLPTIIGVVSILGLTPLFSIPILKIGYSVTSYAVGFAIFWNSPCTMSSAVVLTEECHGNFVLALLLTIITNILCILTEPFMIKFLFGASNVSIKFDVGSMLLELVYSIFAPIIVGKLCLYIPRVPQVTKQYSSAIRWISSICLVFIPFMKISQSSDKILHINGGDIGYILGMAIGMHIVFDIVIFIVCQIFCISESDTKACVFMGASKTLPVAITVLSFMPQDDVDAGLAIIPMLINHFSQLILAALLCSLWNYYDKVRSSKSTSASKDKLIGTTIIDADNSMFDNIHHTPTTKIITNINPDGIVTCNSRKNEEVASP